MDKLISEYKRRAADITSPIREHYRYLLAMLAKDYMQIQAATRNDR